MAALDDFNLPCDIYANHLATIKGIKFTPREIEVISFLSSGRSSKKIASFFSISPKTVENHTRNIMIKLECNSREDILDFIEQAGKSSLLKQYYLKLLIHNEFENFLKDLQLSMLEIRCFCSIIHWQDQDIHNSLACSLDADLKLAGIPTILRAREAPLSRAELVQDALSSQYVIYIIPAHHRLETLPDDGFLLIPETSDCLKNCLLFLTETEAHKKLSQDLLGFDCLELNNQKTYYHLVLEILGRLLPQSAALKKSWENFKEKEEALSSFSEKLFLQDYTPSAIPRQPKGTRMVRPGTVQQDRRQYSFLKNLGTLTIPLTIICILILTLGCAMIFGPISTQKESSIRSDLVIPKASFLLERPALIKKMDNLLKKQDGIQTVALRGIGGAGKTTLSRSYARQQNVPVVWEVNAETHSALVRSFENLAYALAKKEEDQKTLRGLQEIKNQREKEEKTLLFVKENLKKHSKWILIFDNVENFSDLKNHFPSDQTVWGNGSVILTTRDNNIRNNSLIAHSIQVKELTPQEKYVLFESIQKKKTEDVEKTTAFLKEIPSYPLDISIAAYYLKDTGFSYDDYINHMNEASQDFESHKAELLKEVGDYTKTRYGIVTLSLTKLIEEHPDFSELLLFIGMLGSQDIPKDLLATYKDSAIIDQLIHSLRKHSLITSETSKTKASSSTFSIHRSTQLITLAYLAEKLKLKTDKKIIKELCKGLEKYLNIINTDNILNAEEFLQIKSLVTHVETFINHRSLLTDNDTFRIKGDLGYMYYCLALFEKSKNLLEDNFSELDRMEHKDGHALARTLSHLGMLYFSIGQYERCQELLEKNIKTYIKSYIRTDPRLAKTLVYLGRCYLDKGELEKALDVLEQSLVIYQKYFPEDNFGRAFALAQLGNVYLELWNFEKAKICIEESIRIYANYGASKHVHCGRAFGYLGHVYKGLGEFEKSKNLIEKTFTIYKQSYPENGILMAWVLRTLGSSYNDLGDYKKAQELLEQSLKIYRDNLGDDNIKTQWALFDLGGVYINLGRLEHAKNIFERCLMFYEKFYKENYVWIARILRNLGQIYLSEGDTKNAELFMRKALSLLEQNKHPEQYLSFEQLSGLYSKKSEQAPKEGEHNDQANAHLRKAISIAKKYFPNGSPHIKRLQEKLKAQP